MKEIIEGQITLDKTGKPRRLFLLKCRWCGGKQKMIVYGHPVGHIKKCVFCGKNFVIHRSPQDSCIIEEIK